MNRPDAEELVMAFMVAVYDSGYYSGREMSASKMCQDAIKERTTLRDKLIEALVRDNEVQTP